MTDIFILPELPIKKKKHKPKMPTQQHVDGTAVHKTRGGRGVVGRLIKKKGK